MFHLSFVNIGEHDKMNNVTRTLMLLDVEARRSRVEGRPAGSLQEPLYNTNSPQSIAASLSPHCQGPTLASLHFMLPLQHLAYSIIT